MNPLSLLRRIWRKFSRRDFFIHSTATLCHPKNVILSKNSQIYEFVIVRSPKSKLIIGRNSQIGPFGVLITGKSEIQIGDDVMVGPHCVMASGNHSFDNINVPMIHSGSYSNGPIIIEDDVWIGANCTITDNVRIGKGSIIGANSVVTHDVEQYTIVAGVPAKKIKSRK